MLVVMFLLITASYLSIQILLDVSVPSERAVSSIQQLVVNAPKDSVLFIYPESDRNRTKPAGVEYPSEQDFSAYIIAGGIIFGMTKNPQLSTTDSTSYVDRQTGKPQFEGTLVIVGNAQINGAARYYQTSGQVAALLSQDQDSLYVQESTGRVIDSTRVSKQVLTASDSDIFVIELLTDTEGRNVIMVWGYTGRGAISAARMTKFEILANPGKYAATFYVGRWTDASEGSSRNRIPDQGDRYEVLSTGVTAPSATESYVFGWREISALYVVALVLVGLGYSLRKGWIRVETQASE